MWRVGSGVVGALLALAIGWSTAPSLAAGGKALGVDPQAELQSAGQTTTLVVGTDIQIGDVVRTGTYGQVQIKFDDNTELVVGPSSTLVIEDYLLRADNSAGKLTINALAGTFRFATGNAAKDRYSIVTPTGTIGVRGTEFDFTVDGEQTRVLVYHGSVIMCTLTSKCVTLDSTCEVGQYDLSDSIVLGKSIDTTGQEREDLEAAFQYANSQTPLLREFWFDQARECFNKAFVYDAPASLVQNGASGVTRQTPPIEEPGDGPPPDDEEPPPDDEDPCIGYRPYSGGEFTGYTIPPEDECTF